MSKNVEINLISPANNLIFFSKTKPCLVTYTITIMQKLLLAGFQVIFGICNNELIIDTVARSAERKYHWAIFFP